MSDGLQAVWNAVMTHLPVMPVLLPAATAILLLLMGDDGGNSHNSAAMQRNRRLAWGSTLLGALIALALLVQADTGELQVYQLGDWPAPFGIVLVVDRLSALMLVLTSAVALPVLVYASGGWDNHGRYFHALLQFQLMGLHGAFVTGDLFNLFVFFEVLLIASYVLMMHGLGPERLRVGLQYVVLNLLASALFLIGMALVYALTGTLNLADLALRVPLVVGADAAVLQAAAMLLLVVFGFKAALAPLSLWLPATYVAASPPVAALFAIMTKVGVYAIIRVHGVVFGDGAGDSARVVEPVLLPLALLTSVMGVLGALAANTLSRLVAWLTVASVGTVLIAIGLFGATAWAAALYYMVHSTLVMAGLFLLAELVGAPRGDAADRLTPAAPVAQPALLGLLLLLGAASGAGLPPLPGFIGKVMVLQASADHAWGPLLWTTLLAMGFFTLLGLARAGSVLFWQTRQDIDPHPAGAAGASPRLIAATLALMLASVMLSVMAQPVARYVQAAAIQLLDRAAYADAVLSSQGGAAANTARPYTGILAPAAPASAPGARP